MQGKRNQLKEQSQAASPSKQTLPEKSGLEATTTQPDKNSLRRTISNPRAASPENILQLQRTIGNKAVQRLLRQAPAPAKTVARQASVVQRKANKVTSVEELKKNGSTFFNDEYDAVITEVEQYNAPTTPAGDYGKQLIKLEEVGKSITTWEGKNGKADKKVAETFNLIGMSKLSSTDKRRNALVDLKGSLNLETQEVQQQGKTQATSAHSEDRLKLQEYVDNGFKSSETLLKNSCEWIKVGKTKLYALTPTGDSYARLLKGGKNPAKDEAWFPSGTNGAAGHLGEGAATYNEKSLVDNNNVNLDDAGKVTGGWNLPGLIAVTNASKKTEEKVWGTLRHEVQHDSDKNSGRDSWAGVRKAAEEHENPLTVNKGAALAKRSAEIDLQSYKTEYRAYSYQEGGNPGPYAALDNTVQDKNHDGFMFSARQLAIFKHIYKGYDHTKNNWDATPNPVLTDGRTFRQAVQSYWNPDTEGFNKFNSARVDDFYLALDKIGTKAAPTKVETNSKLDFAPVSAKVSDETDATVLDLMAAIDKLHGDDADYIMNEGKAMQKKIKAHLDGKALQLVENKLTDLANDSKMGSISLFD